MIELRAFEPADAEELIAWVTGPEALVTWSGNSGFTWPLRAEQLAAFHASDPSRRALMAVAAGGAPVGHFMLRTEPPGRSVRLGMVLVSPEVRGRGVGRAMLEAALGAAFAEPAVQEVNLGVYTRNEGAARLYERLGFRRGHTEPRATRVGGEWWPSTTMTLPRATWRPHRPAGR
ncbi:GNAT family N-acetyltransferase [Nonomuraea sp. MG754425]|uniref:GNAT family N-acetyltransferase n=1 Tax=Nonomuraea sp. MG754425 TaxID=2570319 RepID=UPI001F3E5FF3|nr:GNAT family protein [Nonomuraea sp. MG754425]MCF6476302.1 GNAT family N-acetyltransferase [Nonomuraea sp. MG754425]